MRLKVLKRVLYRLQLLSIPFFLFRIFKIKKNKIICANFYCKGYGDNPKYICEELLKSSNKYDIVWVVGKNMINDFPSGIRTVKINTIKYIYELATAKVWIFNCRKNRAVKKRKEQFYIQTWHGGIALKKIERDAEDKLDKNYILQAKEDSKVTDLMISNSTFCTNMYRNAFWYNNDIIEVGSPRNDVLIKADTNEKKKKVCGFFNIPINAEILLYAPTFRDNYLNNPYDIDFNSILNILENNTKKNWYAFVRLHPKENCPERFLTFSNKVINTSEYKDVQELIISSSLLITDYSSTMFEAMLANKNVILYANDVEHYNNERGTYFSFSDLPFRLTTNNEELVEALRLESFIGNEYREEYKKFEQRIGLKESGVASKKVAKIIEGIVYG